MIQEYEVNGGCQAGSWNCESSREFFLQPLYKLHIKSKVFFNLNDFVFQKNVVI